MKSFAQALDLVDDSAQIASYIEYHKRVYPEVLAALREIGISRMKIFLLGTRLFMYFEAPDSFDPVRDYQNYALDPRCQAWDALMRKFQKPAPGAKTSEWWTTMREVFDLEEALR